MKKRTLLGIAVAVLLVVVAAHWYFADRGRFTTEAEYDTLERWVDGHDLVSKRDPASILRFAPSFTYLGGQRFVLYGVADTEQHFFVTRDGDGDLESVFWVQYEAYLPGKRYTYDYEDSPLRTKLGAFEFFTDFEVFHFDPDRRRKRGTDGAMVREFLAAHGLAYPREVAYSRQVYLTDETRQKELMIIFMDDLARYGTTADALEGDPGRLRTVEESHLERVEASLTVLPLDGD